MLGLALLLACSGKETEEKAKQLDTTLANETLHRRMLEDVPVEDRKFLQDSMIIIAKASKKSAHTSAALSKHRPEVPKNEVHTYYLVAGSFSSKEEAQLMVNFFETESIPSLIIPHKNMKRVAVKLTMEEQQARARMDSLNERFDGLLEFWFLHDQ